MKKRRAPGRSVPEGRYGRSPRAIAAGLKHDVMTSPRARGREFRSALSRLDALLRHGLPAERRDRLEEARIELIALFARTPEGPGEKRSRKRRAP
jgi:hypothetical protein